MNAKTMARSMVLISVLMALFSPQTAAAKSDPQSPGPGFEFTQEEATFSWQDIEEGKAKIEILNNETTGYQLAFSISGIDFLEIAPITEEPNLPAGGSLEITLAAASDSKPEPRNYHGYLNASLPEKNVTRHLPLTITVADESKITLTSISDTWEMKHIMPVLFWNENQPGQYTNQYLPIETPDNQPCDPDLFSLTRDAALGTLVLPGQDTAEVLWSGTVAAGDEGSCALGLTFKGLDRPGEYSGTIDLLPGGGDDGEVTLKVSSTHSVIWPILTIVLGVLASTVVLNKLNINRPILILLLDEADTENVKDGKEEKEKYKGYVIADFVQQGNWIRDDINRLKKEFRWKVNEVLDENNEEYKSVVDNLKVLDAKVNAWNNEFPNDLRRLEQQLQLIANDVKPKFYDSAMKLLSGCELCFGKPTSDEQKPFSEQHQKIKKAGTISESWIEWKKALDVELKRFQQIDETTLDPDYVQNVKKLKLELSQLQGILWDTEEFEAFDNQAIEDTLDRVNLSLGSLLHLGDIKLGVDMTPLIPVTLTADQYIESRRAGQSGPIVFLSRNDYTPSRGAIDFATIRDQIRKLGDKADQSITPPSEEDLAKKREKRILTLERILHHSDIIMIIISAVGGIYGGLQANYFGQPFGTALDYASVFMWGLGAKATVEGIWAAINRFVATAR